MREGKQVQLRSVVNAGISAQEIAFDIDGVVTDTMSSFLRIASEEYGLLGLKKENITSYWLDKCLDIPQTVVDEIVHRILEDPFGSGLTFHSGARETLQEISAVSTLRFVTARPLGGPIEEWLLTNLAVDADKLVVVATGNHAAKGGILREMGVRYFVEDHLGTCIDLHAMGINAIVFDQPWNRGDDTCVRVRSWGELASMIHLE